MFKVKLWLTVVLFVAAGALLLVAGTPRLHEQLLTPLEGVASSALTGLTGELLIDSEQSVSRAAELANRADVRALFEPPKRGEEAAEVPPALVEALAAPVTGRLGAPAFAAVAGQDGVVLAQTGKESVVGTNVSGYPAFADALTGVMRDGLLRLGEEAFHVAAAPVYQGNEPVGAVLLGWSFGTGYADALGKAVGHPVVLLVGKQRVGSALPGLTVEKLREVSASTSFGELELKLPVAVPVEMPLLVEDRSRFLGNLKPLFGGERTVAAVVAVDRTYAFEAIALAQLAVVTATLVLAVLMLLMVVNILRSISKPVAIIMDHLSAYAQGTATGILPEGALSGPFVRLGKQINMILQSPPPGSAVRTGGFPIAPVGPALGLGAPGEISSPGAPVASPPPPPFTDPGEDDGLRFDGIPGLSDAGPATPGRGVPMPPTSPAPGTGAGFPGALPGTGAGLPPPPPLDEEAAPLKPVSDAPVSSELADSALSSLFDDSSADPLAAFRVQSKPPSPPVAAPPPAAPPPAAPPPAGAAVPLPGGAPPAGAAVPLPGAAPPAPPPAANAGYNPEATVMFQVPQELIQESQVSTSGPALSAPAPSMPSQPTGSFPAPARTAPPAAPPPAAPPQDEGRTVVAQIPQELLSAAAKPADLDQAEQAHFREVYQEFIRTRQQCGEDTADLTYDRFVAKLLKNKQQIVEKYHSKSVRFQVYVKQGKAALRAVPVRD